MPNWCEGDLKIRGHIDDVQKCLEYCIYQGGKVIRSDDSLELIDVGGHLKGAYRCFIPDIYTQDFYPDNVGNIIVILPTEHAWGYPLMNLRHSVSNSMLISDFMATREECNLIARLK